MSPVFVALSVSAAYAGCGTFLYWLMTRMVDRPPAMGMNLTARDTRFSGLSACQKPPRTESMPPSISIRIGSPSNDGNGLPSPVYVVMQKPSPGLILA